MAKVCVAVVMGGPSAEYDISILSGIEVIAHLVSSAEYAVRAVLIGKDRSFWASDMTGDALSAEAIASRTGFKGPYSAFCAPDVWKGIDVAFLALHGAYGEDGCIQGYLETLAIPYTGSGVFASSLAMNKIATKYLLIQNNIATPPFSVYGKHHPETSLESIAAKHGFPCFAKCPQSGSSRLMGRAGSMAELRSLIGDLTTESDEILVETNMTGPEYTCPVLEYPDGRIEALAPVEIRPVESAYFDFHAKYDAGASQEICPAPVSESLSRQIQDVALSVHQIVGCRGMSRTDMILSNGALHVLETNTLPGFTKASLLPKSFSCRGNTFFELADIIIKTALALRGKSTS